MKFLCILALFGVLAANVQAKEVVCYCPAWMDITASVDPSLCTMIMISFAGLDTSGNLQLPSTMAAFKKLKTPTTKLILALGGATAGTWAFEQVSATAASRAVFAQNCLNAVQTYGLDGIDIDWEFPAPGQQTQFVALHQDLKNKLGSNYLVTTAVSAGNWNVANQQIYNIANLAKAVDFINLMTYDYHADAGWDVSSGVYFNAPVGINSGDSVENGINLFLKGGAPASKLNVGVPFYARTYQLSNANQNSPGSPFNGGLQQNDAYTPSYNTYCTKIQDSTYTKKRDATTLCPYMYKGTEWIAYEDEQSIIDKGNLANKYNLGGVMLWAMHQDDYQGVCSSCKWPLLKALNSAIGRAKSCSGGSSNGGTTVVVPTTTSKGPTTTQKATTKGGGGAVASMTSCPSGGYFSNPDCTKYYSCTGVAATPSEMLCPAGLYWNKGGWCDWNCANV